MEENKTLLEKALSKNNKTDEWTFSEEDKKKLKRIRKVEGLLGWGKFHSWTEKAKQMREKSFIENLNEYEPLDVKTFIGENKEENTDNNFWFYKKNYKQIIPFLFRKDRKLNFIYFIASKNKHINDIKDMSTRLSAFYKEGTQKEFVRKPKEKFFNDMLNKVKYFFSFKHETFEEYKYRKLLGRLSLYQQKALLMQQLMDINDKIKHGLVYKNIMKDKQKVINKIEKLKIKIYEAQKHK